MKNVLLACFGVVFLACAGVQKTSNSQAKELSLADILDQHAIAMGGKKRWNAMQTYWIIDSVETGRKTTAYSKKPNQYKLIFEQNGNTLVKSYDGQEGWITKNGVYEAMRPGEAVEMAEEPDFYEELMFAREKGYKTELLGKEELNGTWVYKLAMAKKPDDVHIYYVNAQTFLIDRIGEYSEDKAWEGVYFQTLFEDFRSVDGCMFPFRWALQSGDTPPVWRTVKSIQVNIPLPDSVFQRPK